RTTISSTCNSRRASACTTVGSSTTTAPTTTRRRACAPTRACSCTTPPAASRSATRPATRWPASASRGFARVAVSRRSHAPSYTAPRPRASARTCSRSSAGHGCPKVRGERSAIVGRRCDVPMDTTLASLTGLSSLALAACSLPSATLQPTSSSAPATIVEPPPEQRKPAIRTRGGPVVLDATLTAGGTKLELHVSTPLAPTTGVDPNDFRISMAMAYAYKRYAYAYYYDVGELASDDGELMNIAALHGHGDTLELVLGAPIDPSYCREIEQEMREAEAE